MLKKYALLAAAGLLWSEPAAAQSIKVYSEFIRIRPDGHMVQADSVPSPREILSPATARNAYATFRVVVEAPPGHSYQLHIAQNPDNSCAAKLYQEQYARHGEELLPDSLAEVNLPVNNKLPDGHKVQTYLLDLFIPESTPAGRFRLEVQLYANERWTIYPMEMRPRSILSPVRVQPLGPLPAVTARSDIGIVVPLRETLCKQKPDSPSVELTTARSFVMRNVRQDMLIAEGRVPSESLEGVAGMLLHAAGYPALRDFCALTGQPLALKGPEWWLKARNYIYQGLPVR